MNRLHCKKNKKLGIIQFNPEKLHKRAGWRDFVWIIEH